MAVATTITGAVGEFAFAQLAASLDEQARNHKRLSDQHRRMAQNARRDQATVLRLAAQAGVQIEGAA